MEKAPHRAAIALLVVALAAALAPRSGAVTLGSGALLAAPSTEQCHTIRLKKRVRRWAWIPRTRRLHGRRVVIRRAGRIVHVHARVWRRKTVLRVVCMPTAAVVAPPALTPLPL